MASTTFSPIQALPEELLLQIAKNVNDKSNAVKRQKDLVNLALVSHRFSTIADDILYRSISTRLHQMHGLCRTFTAHPTLGERITSLEIKYTSGTYRELPTDITLPKLPKLKELTLDASQRSAFCKILDRVEDEYDKLPSILLDLNVRNLELIRLVNFGKKNITAFLVSVGYGDYEKFYRLPALKRMEVYCGDINQYTSRVEHLMMGVAPILVHFGVELVFINEMP